MWLWRSWVRAPPLTPFSSKPLGLSLGCRQEVKARDFDSRTVGSNPATPARFDPLAQSVEHLTFNQGVRSSNLRWITNLTCDRGGTGRRASLRSWYHRCVSSSLSGRTICFPPYCCTLKKYAPLAQLVEQLTLNQWVLGSSPRRCTIAEDVVKAFRRGL